MKKGLILSTLTVFALSATLANANPPAPPCECTCNCHKPPVKEIKCPNANVQIKKCPKADMKARQNEFEKKLGLTEEQKEKARELRMKGHDEIKPIIDQIKAKKQEANAVMRSRIAVEDQEKKLAEIKKEIQALKKEAKDIRIKNMKEFESILTDDQKKTLAKMKKEARKNFAKKHKKHTKYVKKECNTQK